MAYNIKVSCNGCLRVGRWKIFKKYKNNKLIKLCPTCSFAKLKQSEERSRHFRRAQYPPRNTPWPLKRKENAGQG